MSPRQTFSSPHRGRLLPASSPRRCTCFLSSSGVHRMIGTTSIFYGAFVYLPLFYSLTVCLLFFFSLHHYPHFSKLNADFAPIPLCTFDGVKSATKRSLYP